MVYIRDFLSAIILAIICSPLFAFDSFVFLVYYYHKLNKFDKYDLLKCLCVCVYNYLLVIFFYIFTLNIIVISNYSSLGLLLLLYLLVKYMISKYLLKFNTDIHRFWFFGQYLYSALLMFLIFSG